MRRIKRIIIVIFLMAALLVCSGCYNANEPKNLAIINSSLYDLNNDGSYKVTVEIINPAGIGGPQVGTASDKNPYITISGTGKSMRDAVAHLSETRAKANFRALNMVRLMSETFASKDVVPLLDEVVRNYDTTEHSWMAVIKGADPERIYDCQLVVMDTVGSYIDMMSIYQPKNMGEGVFVSTHEFIRDYYTEGKEPVAGLINIVESTDKPSGNSNVVPQSGGQSGVPATYLEIKYTGLAAFKEGKMVGMMNGDEAQAYNFITNKIKTAYLSVPSGDDYTAFRVDSSSADIKTETDGKSVTVNITVKPKLDIAQEGGTADVTDPQKQKELEKKFNDVLLSEISKAVVKAQTEFKSDIFGFGQEVHIQHPDVWRQIRDRWNDDFFPNATVNITVESTIVTTEQAEKPIKIEGATE